MAFITLLLDSFSIHYNSLILLNLPMNLLLFFIKKLLLNLCIVPQNKTLIISWLLSYRLIRSSLQNKLISNNFNYIFFKSRCKLSEKVYGKRLFYLCFFLVGKIISIVNCTLGDKWKRTCLDKAPPEVKIKKHYFCLFFYILIWTKYCILSGHMTKA